MKKETMIHDYLCNIDLPRAWKHHKAHTLPLLEKQEGTVFKIYYKLIKIS